MRGPRAGPRSEGTVFCSGGRPINRQASAPLLMVGGPSLELPGCATDYAALKNEGRCITPETQQSKSPVEFVAGHDPTSSVPAPCVSTSVALLIDARPEACDCCDGHTDRHRCGYPRNLRHSKFYRSTRCAWLPQVCAQRRHRDPANRRPERLTLNN